MGDGAAQDLFIQSVIRVRSNDAHVQIAIPDMAVHAQLAAEFPAVESVTHLTVKVEDRAQSCSRPA